MNFAKTLILSVLLFMNFWGYAHDKELAVIRTIGPQSENDTAHLYFTNLIQLALNKSAEKFGPSQLVLSSTTLNQGRWIRMLEQNVYLDVAWGGASFAREDKLIAIPIDLLGGILGVRAMVIRRDDRLKFNNITSLAMLKKLTACQAEHWPDTAILEASGLKVHKTAIFETNFRMLEKGRCDYFPRGIHEAYSEIEKYQILWGNQLILYDELLLVYPFNMWLYVNKENQALAQRIEYGLKQAINDGSFKKIIQTHPVTNHLFPLAHWQGKRLFVINNPLQNIRNTKEAWWLLREFPFYQQIDFSQAKD